MRRFMAAVALIALTCAGLAKGLPGLAPLSAEEKAEGIKNWEAVMAAHKKLNGTVKSGGCSADLRPGMQGCHQYGTDWCWASAATGVAHFFAPEKYGCSGVECQVVGHVKNAKDPNACCTDKASCDKQTGTMGDIVGGINWLLQTSSPTYQSRASPLSQAEADHAVYMGNPVIVFLLWKGRDVGHFVWIGGCSGPGSYYVHDPEHDEGTFTTYSYEALMSLYGGYWYGTVSMIPSESGCWSGHSKGCGTRDTNLPGYTCTNCGCTPCDQDHKCYACKGNGKCFTYDCGDTCSNSPCSSVNGVKVLKNAAYSNMTAVASPATHPQPKDQLKAESGVVV